MSAVVRGHTVPCMVCSLLDKLPFMLGNFTSQDIITGVWLKVLAKVCGQLMWHQVVAGERSAPS